MAGHSKWAKVKHRKAVTDVRKAKLYTKHLREIQVAARLGGANPDGNHRLKTAITAARAVSVPADNIDRAIKRGTGLLEGTSYEEVVYEGYGPGGVAMLVKSLTDNRNRTASEVRHAFSRGSGNLGTVNSVAFQFKERGVITIQRSEIDEQKLFDVALGAGAEDVRESDNQWEVITAPSEFQAVNEAIRAVASGVEGAMRLVPESTVRIAGEDAKAFLELVEALEDLDDVQEVIANCEIDDNELQQLSA